MSWRALDSDSHRRRMLLGSGEEVRSNLLEERHKAKSDVGGFNGWLRLENNLIRRAVKQEATKDLPLRSPYGLA
ncbi:unnamed protein product [Litomosoides sigmodontis]|uniref:Uncharacterized protein n=1 Tax=Litomosoides sigmodontis TaxID=42156 RepID=A0A3P7M692_LITSI|nr:unnamed protein product [Litomosoides sigmodontis]